MLTKQAALNAALDLDKGERQVAPEEAGEPESGEGAPEPMESSAYTAAPPVPGYERGADRTTWQARETPRRQRVLKPPTLRPRL